MYHSALHSHFDIHGAQYHDTILNHCIDILPYRYVSQIPTDNNHKVKRKVIVGL